jgi:anti-sigma factor RsiW
MNQPDPTGLPCIEFVELVTEYLEGALDDDLTARVDLHLGLCASCQSVLAQWREVVRLSGRLAERDVDEIDAATRRRLMTSFRAARGG